MLHLASSPPLPQEQTTPASAPSKVVQLGELRRLLAEKFPAAPPPKGGRFRTGIEQIDRQHGLICGAVTEICGCLGAGSLLLSALLQAAQQEREYAGLIDAGRSFDALDLPPAALERLLWVLCDGAQMAVKAADLLLRDGNLPLVLLDLQSLPLAQLRRIPASTWHRFQRIAEQGRAAFVVLTPRPMIEGARMRIAAERRWSLHDLTRRRQTLLQGLELKIFEKSNALFSALDRQLKSA